jgi:predicted enzyme related to lactoylglutathione lyase
MPRPVHFEILARNPEEISSFYQQVFDWKIDAWSGGDQKYWLVTTGGEESPGINGGIMARCFEQAVINTIAVESLDDMIAKVEAAGGRKVNGPNKIPDVGLHVYCTDPEGNLFGMIQMMPA